MKNQIYFVVTREIANPETQEPLLTVGQTLYPSSLRYYNDLFGIDHIPCEVCIGDQALETITNRVLFDA